MSDTLYFVKDTNCQPTSQTMAKGLEHELDLRMNSRTQKELKLLNFTPISRMFMKFMSYFLYFKPQAWPFAVQELF